MGHDQLRPREADGAIESVPPAEHHHFILESGGIRKAPDAGRVRPGDARCRRGGDGGRRARGHHSRFRARHLCQPLSRRALQLEDIDEVLRRGIDRPANLGKLERAAEVRPRSAGVDEGPHSDAAVDVGGGFLAEGGFDPACESPCGDSPENRRGGYPLEELAAVRTWIHGSSPRNRWRDLARMGGTAPLMRSDLETGDVA